MLNVEKNAYKILYLRICQMFLNERYKAGEFKIPIHLAFGHETIAVAVDEVMQNDDRLILPHRNIHYNLARSRDYQSILNEFLLQKESGTGPKRGSMNLANESFNIPYTSSILGNNLSVAAGLAMAQKVKDKESLVFVVTGDGAMEEGAFYESLMFMKTYKLPVIVIVENNGWSLATQIHERRCKIDLNHFSQTFDVPFLELRGNDPFDYINKLNVFRSKMTNSKTPGVVEVHLETLGDWRLKTDEYPDGKYINYHAGPAPTVSLNDFPVIREDENDPVYVLNNYLDKDTLKRISKKICKSMNGEEA